MNNQIERLLEEIEQLKTLLKEIESDGRDAFLLGERLKPPYVHAHFMTNLVSDHDEVPCRLRIAIDSGELIELARWAEREAVSAKEDEGISYLELRGQIQFDLHTDDEAPVARRLIDLLQRQILSMTATVERKP